MKRRAVFLDKDGIVSPTAHPVDAERMELVDGAAAGLRRLHAAGYQLVVVSNQPGVAHGFFPESDLVRVEARLRQLLAAQGVPLTGFYYCPHHPQGEMDAYATVCLCRKPRPGMLLQAAADHGLDLGQSWMVGNVLDDIDAGYQAGCHTVLVAGPRETEWRMSPERLPDMIVDDFATAADGILTRDEAAAPKKPPERPTRRRTARPKLEEVWS